MSLRRVIILLLAIVLLAGAGVIAWDVLQIGAQRRTWWRPNAGRI